MSTFFTLYKFELRKILRKKLTIIFVILGLLVIIGTCFLRIIGGYYVDGQRICSQYERLQRKRSYAEEYNSKEIDNELLQKMSDAWYAYCNTDDLLSVMDEADKYWYIMYFAEDALFLDTKTIADGWQADINDLYERRKAGLEEIWEQIKLTESEKEFWRDKEAKIERPAIFRLCDAYGDIISYSQAVGLVMLIVITAALSGVFCDEHTRRTDQLIFVSAKGKTTLYSAKLLAGMTFGIGLALLLCTASMVTSFSIYGTDGKDAALQFICGSCSLPITASQGVLIVFGELVAAAAIYSIFIMLISEAVHSSVSGLAIGMTLVMASLIIAIPDSHRILEQIFEALPTCYISPSSIFSPLTYPFFGTRILPCIAVPIIYLIGGIIIWLAGKKLYSRYQISGR